MSIIEGVNTGAGNRPLYGNYRRRNINYNYLHLDAQNSASITATGGLVNGNTVTQWNNLRLGVPLTQMQQPDSQALPTYATNAIGGHPAVAFNGSTQSMTSNASLGLTHLLGLSMTVVFKLTGSPVDGDIIVEIYTNQNPSRLWGGINASTFFPGGRRLDSDSFEGYLVGSHSLNGLYVYTVSLHYSVGRIISYLNNVVLVDDTFQTPGYCDSAESFAVQIGGNYNFFNLLVNCSPVTIGEVIVDRVGWTSTFINAQHTALRTKWGF